MKISKISSPPLLAHVWAGGIGRGYCAIVPYFLSLEK